jgi:2-oxoisovalerate dehydrogenase E2 component (dihydrolipoyl transacylase)
MSEGETARGDEAVPRRRRLNMSGGETTRRGAGDSPPAAAAAVGSPEPAEALVRKPRPAEALVRKPRPAEALVRMPKLADTLVEGTVGQWLKQVGETVARGEPLVSIETDKVTTELTSPAAGTVLELLISAGTTVPVQTPIARIGDPAVRAARATHAPAHAIAAAAPPVPAAPKPTPLAAKLLAEHGLSADQVPARSSRLTKDEVLAFIQSRLVAKPPLPRRAEGGGEGWPAAQSPGGGEGQAVAQPPLPRRGEGGGEGWPAAPPPIGADGRPAAPPPIGADGRPAAPALIPLTPMRRAIADHMTRARQTIPHGQSVMDADLTHLVAWRNQHKADFIHTEGANLTFTVLFVHALARALAATTNAHVGIGVAVALEAGLIVPVLRSADSLSLGQTARGIADVAERARANKLAADETQGATMTVTNVGSFGNLSASPIVPLSQIGILGPGLVERRPLPGPDGAIRPGWRCLLSLVFDRRALTDFEADHLLRATITQLMRFPSAVPGGR